MILCTQLFSHWEDGPCRSCFCLPADDDSSHPTAECQVTACPTLETDSDNFVFSVERKPGMCCPERVWKACKDDNVVFQVSMHFILNTLARIIQNLSHVIT